MKIAAVSDDGVSISQHLGKALTYVVTTVEDGKIVGKEARPKTGHHTFAAEGECLWGGHPHPNTSSGERHGFDAGAQSRHASLIGTIADCQVLIAGGMGRSAYRAMQYRNIKVVTTTVESIDDAVRLYLEGKLPSVKGRLH